MRVDTTAGHTPLYSEQKFSVHQKLSVFTTHIQTVILVQRIIKKGFANRLRICLNRPIGIYNVRIMHMPRVELFARQTPPGWAVWGNEVTPTIPDFGTHCPKVQKGV